MDNKINVTVLITTFNRAELLKRCLLAALKQNFKSYEILVVDDCSSDNTSELIDELIKEYPDRIRFISKASNCGLAHSRNLGLRNAKGKYISFLDDDDFWLTSDVLIEQYKKASIGKIVCGSVRNSEGRILTKILPNDWKSRLVYRNGFIHTSSVMIAKEDIHLAGGFDEKMSRGIDSDLYRRMVFQFDVGIAFVPLVLSHYELGSANRITTKKRSKLKKAIFIKETMYVLFKYRFLVYKYPLEYFKRCLISLKYILR